MRVSFLFLILLTSSCAYFINNFDPNRLSQEISTYKPSNKKLYCKNNTEVQLVNSNKASQRAFSTFLNKTKLKLSFADKAVLWSLAQMNLRPDLASPTSKLQIFIKTNKGFDYFHFYSKEKEAYPYTYGLSYILKKYNSRHSLLKLANALDKNFPNVFTVNKELEVFLSENKKAIAANPLFEKKYMRADETLKENEKVPRVDLSYLIKSLPRSNAKVEVSESLFEYKTEANMVASCNYDMKLYSNSIYLIHDDFIKSHLFGFKNKEGSFLASATQRKAKISPVGKSIFFKGESQTRSAAFCSFKSPVDDKKNLWLVSSDSRDPGQHIYHIMEYGIKSSSSPKEVSELIAFSRHLFLEDPTRLIFESNRSSKQQLDGLLKLNLPIYNARKLGNVWAMYKDKNDHNLIIDDRTDGQITCGK